MNTSAHLARRSTIFAASGDLRSIATPRLLRLFRCHMYGTFDKGWGGILFPILHNSPLGGSTLITSAPKSDKMTAAPGPATKLERSTTFNPEKIFSVVFSVVINVFFFGLASLELGCALLQERLCAFLFVFRSGAESEERSFE